MDQFMTTVRIRIPRKNLPAEATDSQIEDEIMKAIDRTLWRVNPHLTKLVEADIKAASVS
jgi:hypothetical protein